jgi:hypothetical protein
MAAHLHCVPEALLKQMPGDCSELRVPMDSWYDSGFPPEVIQWANDHCAGCASWQNGTFQCVVFVIASYAFSATPLPVGGENANQYWSYFAGMPGWAEVPAGNLGSIGAGKSLVEQNRLINQTVDGAIMAWAGGPYGHVSIVLSVDWPHSITFAQANGQKPVQTLPLRPDGTVNTANGYWNYFEVQGYIYPTATTSNPGGLPTSPYVQVALAAARTAGIPDVIFARQIDVESGYNPKAVSAAGAIGIAQFMPATAAALGIDPWNPVQSLYGAAQYMAGFLHTYGGDEAKALAAYNAGGGTVDWAVANYGGAWLAHMPRETQQYVASILG